jgi:hypothetical protein
MNRSENLMMCWGNTQAFLAPFRGKYFELVTGFQLLQCSKSDTADPTRGAESGLRAATMDQIKSPSAALVIWVKLSSASQRSLGGLQFGSVGPCVDRAAAEKTASACSGLLLKTAFREIRDHIESAPAEGSQTPLGQAACGV